MTSRTTIDISRRRFVVAATAGGLGLSVGMSLPIGAQSAAPGAMPTEVNAWVTVDPENQVTVRVARSEMGQGTLTGLVQLVAEELECDWNTVNYEFPTPGQSLAKGRPWGSYSTGGSRGIRGSHQYVREGGALARALLIAAAAKTWSVDATECRASNGFILHDATHRELPYGAVAAKAAKLPPPDRVDLKDPADWKVIGTSMPRLDTKEKVSGALRYGADIKLPGMLHATILNCPVHGGSRQQFDGSHAEQMPGVRAVVPIADDAIAVIAETWWQAKNALDAVEVVWETGSSGKVSSAEIDAWLTEGLSASEAYVGLERGAAKAMLKAAERTITADYGFPYQNHAPMEPMNATVRWTDEFCEAWVPTQNGEGALEALADGLGMLREQVEIHKTMLGGGFGRRANHDWLVQAGLIAQTLPGTPIKMMWSREEDQRQGRLHPVTKSRLTARLGTDGLPEALHVRLSGQSIIAALRPPMGEETIDPVVFQALAAEGDHAFIYDVEHMLADHAMRNPHIRPWFWRGVNINQNVFYLESFLDELAKEAAIDPYLYRRKLLEKTSPEGLAVLDSVAKRADWGRELPAKHGLGLAVCKAFGSYVAACAEVAVIDGRLEMKKIWAATDCGHAVNPQQIEAQVAGSFVYGLSAALYSEITIKDGAIQEENFHTYPSMKIAAMPEVETEVLASGGFWGGVGEPTIAVAAPAVLNGVFAATGVRIRNLPVKEQPLS